MGRKDNGSPGDAEGLQRGRVLRAPVTAEWGGCAESRPGTEEPGGVQVTWSKMARQRGGSKNNHK